MLRKILALVGVVLTSTSFAVGSQAPTLANDVNGDPLPSGAIARIGTTRFRHEDIIRFAAFLPDGKSLVSIGGDRTIRVWEFPTGKELRRMEVDKETASSELAVKTARLLSKSLEFVAAISPDGKTIATYFEYPTVVAKKTDIVMIHLHDIVTGKELPGLKSDGLKARRLIFSPNGEQVMSTDYDGTVRIWDVAQARELRKFKTAYNSAKTIDTGVRFLLADTSMYSPDGTKLVFLQGTQAVKLLDPRIGEDVGAVGHTMPVTSIRFSPDIKQIITQADDGLTRKWDAGAGKYLGLIARHAPETTTALNLDTQAVSPDGKILIQSQTVRQNQSEFSLRDSATNKEISHLSASRSTGVYQPSLMFSPDNKLVAIVNAYFLSRGKDETGVELFDVATGKLLHTFKDAREAQPAKKILSLGAAPTMAFSADNRLLVTTFGENISLWDTTTGKRIGGLTTLNGLAVRNLDLTFDSRCLAVDTNDDSVVLYELATASPRRRFGNPAPLAEKKSPLRLAVPPIGARMQTQPGSHVAIAPDGKSLAFAGEDRKVYVWDIATGKELAAFEGHAGKVNAVAFSPDSKRLASASADTTALVWDISKLDRAALAAKALQPAELEQAWKTLGEGDGTKAFTAICDLSASPKEAVAFIKDRLKPSAPPDTAKVEALIAKLDDAQFKVRDQASAELTKIGEPIVTALDKALAGNLTLESKRRLEELRNRLTSVVLQGDRLVAYRAVEVLERIGTPEARQVLQELANGAPETLLTTSAQAALKRL